MDDPHTGWVRLETERAFRQTFAGRCFAGEGFDFTIHADGRLTGRIGDADLVGRWYWHEGFFCRTASLGGEDLGLDCEVIEARPGEMRYTQNMGAGETSVVALRSETK